MLTSRSNGNTDCAISSVSGQPGRSGCGTSSRASTATASTAFVDGAITPVRMLRVATSTAIVNSARRATPSAYRHRMSIVFVSICTCSPGRTSTDEVNGRSGRLSWVRRVVAAPKVCRPRSSRAANRYNSRSLGITRPSPCSAASADRTFTNIVLREIVDPAACPVIASANADSTRPSAAANGSRPANRSRTRRSTKPIAPSWR